ncbi:MAG: ATP-binding protein [Ruminiclostridium sp.]|nr:ATP-binding protein [Ruminiclostridium sp.]
MEEIDILAIKDNLPQVLDFVEGALDELGCDDTTKSLIGTAVEEVFINIASYAYPTETGTATIRVATVSEPLSITMTFIDNGERFDPLAKPAPDLKLPMSERKKGGLGIFMVKKIMDSVKYEYKDGQNILTIVKNV